MNDSTGCAQRSQPANDNGVLPRTSTNVDDDWDDLFGNTDTGYITLAIETRLRGCEARGPIPKPSRPVFEGRLGELRSRLRDRDGWRCRICGGNFPVGYVPHCDHVHPRKHGGSDRLPNRQLAHSYCNLLKLDKVDWELEDEFYTCDIRIACWWDELLGEWCHHPVYANESLHPSTFALYRRNRLWERGDRT